MAPSAVTSQSPSRVTEWWRCGVRVCNDGTTTTAVEYNAAPQSRRTSRFLAPSYDRRAQRPPFSRRDIYRYDVRDEPTHYTREDDARFIKEQSRFRPLPVCYSCGVPGHISRFCNRRVAPRYGPPPQFTRPSERPHDVPRATHLPPSDDYWARSFRNRSPTSDRSLTPPPRPRAPRSPSPLRRTTSPLPSEN